MAIMIRKQRGAAGIYMALLLIPLFGAVFLALEGTRYIQKQNRLADAAEAAALAVTMANHGNTSSYEKELAEKYIQAYVRDINNIQKIEVKNSEGESTVSKIKKNYTQYKVTARTRHNSWFSSTLIPSFSPIETVANQAVARNYPEILGDVFVDIVFVSDFSTSMGRGWESDPNTIKIQSLKNAIEKISKEILSSDNEGNISNNRIGFVPFSIRTQEKKKNNIISCESNLRYSNEYESIDWGYWSELDLNKIIQCANNQIFCNNNLQSHAEYVLNVRGGYYNLPDKHEYIEYSKTINNIFNQTISNTSYSIQNNRIWDENAVCSKRNLFWTINLTNKIDDLDPIYHSMEPIGWTAAYQGILKGAKVLYAGNPGKHSNKYSEYKKRKKLILILSDGQESPYANILPNLVKKGMCKAIKEEFNKINSENPLYMGVIGIDFKASKENGYIDCVGKENIMDVDDVDDLIKTIKEQIKKGSQAEGISKLHYRYID